MHQTQHHIMAMLLKRSPRRYSELRPKGMEGNVFMYHLREVMAEGLVEKVPAGYGLTLHGKHYVDRLSSETLEPHQQPYILVDIVCRNEAGEWLLFQQGRQPYAGRIGFPAGLLKVGESVADVATAEFTKKTGLEATVKLVGSIYVTTYESNELASAVLSIVCLGTVTGGTLRPGLSHGQAFWRALDEKELAKPEYFPALKRVIWHVEHLPKEGMFFGEYSFSGTITA